MAIVYEVFTKADNHYASLLPNTSALVKAVIYFESIIVEKITQVPELSNKGWNKQRSIWDILKDPGASTTAAGGLVALRRPSGAPQYGYFDSSDWKSAADETFGPFNPLFLHRSFRPQAFY
ncbi:hypothetical protein HPB50_029373 [Hyalomma asiaticum]|nr:hypothetical protein HPB50_029373 [Hyalomma asiaticum]